MDKITNEWSDIETFVGYKVPMFLKLILWESGYDCMISIKEITNDKIIKLEDFIQKKRNKILYKILSDLEKLNKSDDSLNAYKEQQLFQFLPGHRNILLSLRGNIERMQQAVTSGSDKLVTEVHECTEEYSVILTELFKTAKNNLNKSKHAYQYNDIVRYFSAYIFLLCGRTCYETLNKNLPIPSTKTICK